MGSIGTLTEVFPNTATPFSVSTSANRLFRLQSPVFQTVNFSFELTGSFWNTVFTVYNWNSTTSVATPIGSAVVNSAVVSFSMDFPTGDYIICIRPGTANAQAGSFAASFTGYSQTANMRLEFYDGGNSNSNLTSPIPPRECNEALFFQILDGELPPGLQMDYQGTITGLLPNLDCLPDSPSPAVNWYFTDNDGTAWPWGRMWRFYVKVWVDGLENVAADEDWFCVKVHNNWTFDLDNFMEQSPFEQVHNVRVVEPPKPLAIECAPCDQMIQEQFIPQPVNTVCEPCQNQAEANRVELIAIPVELSNIQPNDVVAWYVANKDIETDNLYINKFIRDLESSDVFQIMLKRFNYSQPANEYADLEFAVASNYQNYLQLAEIRLDPNMNPESLTVLMAQWRDYVNQALPTTAIGYSGEQLNVNFA
jgi:hypothetical protein